MKKLSGETRLLLIMGLIVLAGGGYLAFSQSGNGPGPNGATPPTPEATPKPLTVAEFDKLFDAAKHRKGMQDGSKTDIAILEFGDVECPSCRYAYQKLTHDFGTKIPVEFAFKHFPLPNHNTAKPCAQALEAADKQGKFWPLYSALFEEEEPMLDVSYVEGKAKKVGLDLPRFIKDCQAPETVKLVEDDTQLGHDMVVMRTPTFFVRNRAKNTVEVAIGAKALMDNLKGLPNVPTPEPTKR